MNTPPVSTGRAPVTRAAGEDPNGGRSAERRRDARIGGVAEAYALVGLTVVAAILFSVIPATSTAFPTSANFQAIAGSQAVLVVATLAVLVPLVCEEFDLSVGANLGLSSVLAASAMKAGAPLPVGIVVGIASGLAVGLINGLLVIRARVNAVIVTLGASTIIAGIVQARTHGEALNEGIPGALLDLGGNTVLGVPQILVAALVIAGLLFFVLAYTPYGRQLYLLGANRSAARLVGLRTERLLFSSFAVAGVLAGIGGVLQLGRAGTAAPTVGATFTLPAFAAAFLSAAAIKPGRYNVWGCVAAIAFLAVINGGLNLAGADTYVSDFVNGVALIAGVALAVALGRRRTR